MDFDVRPIVVALWDVILYMLYVYFSDDSP